jgi:hypothetical protein
VALDASLRQTGTAPAAAPGMSQAGASRKTPWHEPG